MKLLLLLFNILVRGSDGIYWGRPHAEPEAAVDTERLTNSQLILVMLACILFRHWPPTRILKSVCGN